MVGGVRNLTLTGRTPTFPPGRKVGAVIDIVIIST